MTKISDLSALTGASVDTAADLLPIVDMSLAGAARNKKITIDEARIGLGLGTAASPQFTGINLGHASDTTITRASAGVIAVEGVNVITTAGGTFTGDIIVPDEAYDATAWNGSLEVPTKNAVRDKIESMSGTFTAASTTEVLTGTDSAKGGTPDSIAALWEQGSDIASAATISIGEGGYFNVTGTTTITDIDFGTDKAGRKVWLKFAGVLTLTHHSTTLILPTGASITTAAGDTACFVSEGSDNVRCVSYNRASGAALSGSIGAAFHGALVRKAADQTGANYSAGANVAWDQEVYDTDSIHDNVTNNSRLTVPSGVSYIRLTATVAFANVSVDTYILASIFKGGSGTYDGFTAQSVEVGTITTPRVNLTSPVLAVSPGDYFEIRLTIEDTSVDITATQSSFAMEIVG